MRYCCLRRTTNRLVHQRVQMCILGCRSSEHLSAKELEFHILDLCKTNFSTLRKVAVFLFLNAILARWVISTKNLRLTSRGRPTYKKVDDLIRSRSSCSPVSGIVPHYFAGGRYARRAARPRNWLEVCMIDSITWSQRRLLINQFA